MKYIIIFKKEEEGGYTVTVPSLPGCVSYGNTLEEAKTMIKDAINAYLEVRNEINKENNQNDNQDDSNSLIDTLFVPSQKEIGVLA